MFSIVPDHFVRNDAMTQIEFIPFSASIGVIGVQS